VKRGPQRAREQWLGIISCVSNRIADRHESNTSEIRIVRSGKTADTHVLIRSGFFGD
jgi:hypothetical protein